MIENQVTKCVLLESYIPGFVVWMFELLIFFCCLSICKTGIKLSPLAFCAVNMLSKVCKFK